MASAHPTTRPAVAAVAGPVVVAPVVVEAIRRHATRLEATASAVAWPLERLARRPRVTVIIPIFNASEALARCLDSLVAAGDPCDVLLVDDHSHDPRIAEVGAELARRWPSTRQVRNDRNLGFVQTVNRGMREAAAGNDVLLLNSDTEVSPGWLRRLGLAAHLDEACATVCPVSNAAGIFTVPQAHGDAPLPAGMSTVMCQRALGLLSERAHEVVPSTSGFCMLIKRTALERVGLFDSGLFLRGYGEETDFNERATGAGLVHRVDESSFVFHERGLSFGASKEKLKRTNGRILAALHPGVGDRARAWEATSDLGGIREPYAALLAWVAGVSDAERHAVLGAAPRVVEVGVGAAAGCWQAGQARIAVTAAASGAAEVDLFGLARARVAARPLEQLVFEVAYRWDATAVVATDEASRPAVARVVAALGLPR